MGADAQNFLLFGGLLLAGLVVLGLAVWLILFAFAGAVVMLSFAAAQGFIGLVAFVAAWVFLFPFMLAAAIVLGFLFRATEWRESRSVGRRGRREEELEREAAMWRHKILGKPLLPPKNKSSVPPDDPAERYKWANRLPTYDK